MTNDKSTPPTRPSLGAHLRSAPVVRLLLAGVALLVVMGFQLAASVTDWSASTADPAGFIRTNALGLIGVVGGVALVVAGLVRGLRR